MQRNISAMRDPQVLVGALAWSRDSTCLHAQALWQRIRSDCAEGQPLDHLQAKAWIWGQLSLR